jgi:hypothetical protein
MAPGGSAKVAEGFPSWPLLTSFSIMWKLHSHGPFLHFRHLEPGVGWMFVDLPWARLQKLGTAPVSSL